MDVFKIMKAINKAWELHQLKLLEKENDRKEKHQKKGPVKNRNHKENKFFIKVSFFNNLII